MASKKGMHPLEKADPEWWEIGDIISKLIQQQQFYATILAGIERIADTSIATMGLSYSPKSLLGVRLRYNPDFVRKYAGNPLEFQYMIETVASHLLMQHMLREWVLGVHKMSLDDQKKYGLSQSMAISSLLCKLNTYKGMLDYDVLKPLLPEDLKLPSEQTFEAYKHLLDDIEKNGTPDQKEKLKDLMQDKNFNISYRFEDGEIGDDGTLENGGDTLTQGDIDKAAAQQRMNLQDYLNEAIRSAKSRGHLPGWISEVIEDWFDVGAPNWASLLKAAIATGEMASRKSCWVRPNRRLIGLKKYRNISTFPGKRRDPGYRIVAIVDTSGSMDKHALKECLGVIWKMIMMNEDYEFWVVEADYDVQHHQRVHEASQIRQIAHFGLKGRGGTSFKIPLEWTLKTLKPDIIVYCTDGECHEEMDIPSVPVIWFYTENGTPPQYGFGKTIQISVKGNVRNGREDED